MMSDMLPEHVWMSQEWTGSFQAPRALPRPHVQWWWCFQRLFRLRDEIFHTNNKPFLITAKKLTNNHSQLFRGVTNTWDRKFVRLKLDTVEQQNHQHRRPEALLFDRESECRSQHSLEQLRAQSFV